MQVVELKLSDFYVQPTAAQQIVESCPDRFKVKRPSVVRGRQHVEADVLRQRPGGMKIQTAPIETVRSDPRLDGGNPRPIDTHATETIAVPLRRDAPGHGPIRRLLENGGGAIIPHLVAVVLKRLPERAQFGPSLVTGRARHS